jgi:5'-nucleotidase (lipoprotein e(P4) family)
MKAIIFISMFFLAACSTTQVPTSNNNQSPGIIVDGKYFATVFQQKAAEYRALCFQAYNIARLRLDNYKPLTNKPKAIITDIDETLLDNSPYAAYQALQGKDYEPASWSQWIAKASADTMPGAASFLKYAASKGVTIFYITNRNEKEKEGTIKNLRSFDLPNADDAHFMPKKDSSSKEGRRQSVLATHEIVMLVGDNLSDFSSLFDRRSTGERLRNTNFSAADFGNRFIVLPNSTYGDWESALYNYNRYTLAQRDSVMRLVLKGY